MDKDEMKNKYTERAKIFQQAMESCKSSSPMDCIEWFADRIAELGKENAELKENLKTAYRKGMRHMAKALKDYDRTDGLYTDYFEHSVDKVLQREQLGFEKYGTLADQLTKAKELLKKLLSAYTSYADSFDDRDNEIIAETEQFLSEVEK